MIDLFDFIGQLQRELATGHAKEHSYRPALKTLFDSLEEGVEAVNEPKREAVGQIGGRRIARQFKRAKTKDVEQLLQSLTALGQATLDEAGVYSI